MTEAPGTGGTAMAAAALWGGRAVWGWAWGALCPPAITVEGCWEAVTVTATAAATGPPGADAFWERGERTETNET